VEESWGSEPGSDFESDAFNRARPPLRTSGSIPAHQTPLESSYRARLYSHCSSVA
jgi:hypothetical protein